MQNYGRWIASSSHSFATTFRNNSRRESGIKVKTFAAEGASARQPAETGRLIIDFGSMRHAPTSNGRRRDENKNRIKKKNERKKHSLEILW